MINHSDEKHKAAIEAVLFTMGRSVEGRTIADALEISESEVQELAEQMARDYEREDRGIRLLFLDSAYQLCTKAEYYETLIRIAKRPAKPVLTEVVLEVLSIIAYKQPVTKGEIERIRGVQSDYAVNRLLEYGLIEEVGRLDAPGRPMLFATTEEFLRQFGISSTRELPAIDDETFESARDEAEKAVYGETGEHPEEGEQDS